MRKHTVKYIATTDLGELAVCFNRQLRIFAPVDANVPFQCRLVLAVWRRRFDISALVPFQVLESDRLDGALANAKEIEFVRQAL
jgi:hypothetical protein